MIKSIFFSKFLTREGPRVLHQVPDGSIVPTATSSTPPLLDFDSVSSFLIPRQEFCDRLVTICSNRYRILGYPVCITSRRYDRNEFIFNFAIVLEEDKDMSSYMSVVRKLAGLFRSLEEQYEFLSRDGGNAVGTTTAAAGRSKGEKAAVSSKVFALCEIVLEDLNNYCECMIPIDDSNTIDIKLFPMYPPPSPIKAWHVPLSTVRLESLMDANWDLTMQRVVPYIDGINSVKRISELADADYNLVQKCMEHLLYYGCLLVLDVFSFSSTYAPTASISALFHSPSMQAECAAYIASTGPPLPHHEILSLYARMHQGLPLRTWCIENKESLSGVDVRRFVTFGVIKGFLYRVHRWVVGPDFGTKSTRRRGDGKKADDMALVKFLDGMHCLDEICTELQCSEREVMKRLKSCGEVQIINK
ncbi:MAG: Nitrogen permease regulator 2 [Caeruleum heppii]|nr:MAG: Nitrogen permease regulator 2 [Caeruleum heppii]